jgi:hypothetical protein
VTIPNPHDTILEFHQCREVFVFPFHKSIEIDGRIAETELIGTRPAPLRERMGHLQ